MRIALIIVALVIASPCWGAASIVAAWNNYSCALGKSCTGPAINSTKQGTNSAYWGGVNGVSVDFSKSGGRDVVTVSNVPPMEVNCTSGSQIQDIILFGRVTICKTDSTSNTVTITDSTPRVVPLDPLSIQGECADLSLSTSGIWHVR